MGMKKSEQEPKPGEVRPVSKATMDAPQEEFIADEAGVVAEDQAGDGRSKEAPARDKKKPSEPSHS